MIRIDQLHLQLPPAYENQAASIARLVATELAVKLANSPLGHARKSSHISIPAIQLHKDIMHNRPTAKQLARTIAHAIHVQIAAHGMYHD